MNIPFVNGWKNPKFVVKDANNNILLQHEFPELNKDGLIEKHMPIMKVKELINFRKKWRLLGWRIEFTLHYNQWITGNTLLMLKQILDKKAENSENKIYITPRIDDLGRNFEVLFTSEAIEIGIHPGEQNSIGNRLPVLRLETVDIYKLMQITNPLDKSINLSYLKVA